MTHWQRIFGSAIVNLDLFPIALATHITMIVLTDEEWDKQHSELALRFRTVLLSAQSSTDLASELAAVVKEYPTSASANALAESIIDAIQTKPSAIDVILPAIASKSFLPSFESTQIDWAGNEGTWSGVFTVDFLDLLDTVLFERQLYQQPRTTVEPSNRTLVCALLSGAMIRYGCLIPGTHIPHRFANTALRSRNGGRAEVYAIGVCLQLGVAGVPLLQQLAVEYGYKADEVLEKLRKFEQEGYVAYPPGVQVLKVRFCFCCWTRKLLCLTMSRRRLKMWKKGSLTFLPLERSGKSCSRFEVSNQERGLRLAAEALL